MSSPFAFSDHRPRVKHNSRCSKFVAEQKQENNQKYCQLLRQYQVRLECFARKLAVIMKNSDQLVSQEKTETLDPGELAGLRQLIVGLSALLRIRREMSPGERQPFTDRIEKIGGSKLALADREQPNLLSRGFTTIAARTEVSLERLWLSRTRWSADRGQRELAPGNDWCDFLYALLAGILQRNQRWSSLQQQNHRAYLGATRVADNRNTAQANAASYLEYAADYLLPRLLIELNREIKKHRAQIPFRTTLQMPGTPATDSSHAPPVFLPVMTE